MRNQNRVTAANAPFYGRPLNLALSLAVVLGFVSIANQGLFSGSFLGSFDGVQKREIASTGQSKKSQEKTARQERERDLKMRDVNEALSDSFAERRDVESSYESNSSAGRPRNIKTETARVRVELGDELGGWSLRRNRDSSNDHVAADTSEASMRELRRIEARLDRESREVRAEVKNSADQKSKKSASRYDR